ncbi:MAG TPA: hypothetical protein VFS15_10955 [Kofleriaceae bacterium]|nr:hypothetical protein [Kofleriaceae bacterium]
MGVVIYGRRAYGRVHAHEGEYADTQFAHVDFIPLFPISSFWVTQDLGNGQRMGFPIKMHGKSVLATYLRIWGLPIAIGLLIASSSVGGMVAGAIVGALSIWSWTWRARRGELAKKRSDFDRVALGSRCDPAWMTEDMRERIATSLQNSLAKREDARPPDDVARFGAKDVQEAVLAYGLLRISAVKHKAAAEAADRLLASAFEELPSDGGPYRENIGSAVPELGAAISAAARAAAQAARVQRRPRWFHKPWVQAIGLALLTPMAIAGAGGLYHGLGPARAIGHKELSSIHPPTSTRVAVTCDAVQDLGWQVLEGDDVKEEIVFCQIGQHLLPVVSAKGESPTAPGTTEGVLKYIPETDYSNNHPWVDALHQDAQLDGMSYEVYLSRDSSDRKLDIVLGGAFVLGILAGWTFWIRAFVRRRRAKAA